MQRPSFLYNGLVAAFLCGFPLLAHAQSDRASELLDRLAEPDTSNWQVLEQELVMLWSQSGSATADYLLRQARTAIEAQDLDAAYNHLTALTDHAPEFAEGWNTRAILFFQAQRFGPAIADIQRVLALEPRHFGALSGLGHMLEQMERPEEALTAFLAAREIHPHRDDINGAITRLEQQLEGQAL